MCNVRSHTSNPIGCYKRDMKYTVINKQVRKGKKTLENTEGTIKNGQSRETGNIGYTRRRQTKQKHKKICVGHHYTQANTNKVNKTWALQQTTAGKDEPEDRFYAEIATEKKDWK